MTLPVRVHLKPVCVIILADRFPRAECSLTAASWERRRFPSSTFLWLLWRRPSSHRRGQVALESNRLTHTNALRPPPLSSQEMAAWWGAGGARSGHYNTPRTSHLGPVGGQGSDDGGQRAALWLWAKVGTVGVRVWLVSFIPPLALSRSIGAGSVLASAKRSMRH